MGLIGGLFKVVKEIARETAKETAQSVTQNALSKQTAQKPSSAPKKKQVMYQCRYCGYKSIRNATDGAPSTVAHCPKHPKGWCKGVHSWMRTYL